MVSLFRRNSEIAVLIAAALVMFAMRIPLLSKPYINTDEHTFMIMATSVAQGHLPYVETWDNKPPLLFMLLAPLAALTHHQIWIVHVVAALLDVLNALLVKAIADRYFGKSRGHLLCALLCFAAATRSVAGGALMSETIALPFMLLPLLLLARPEAGRWRYFVAGVCLGIATLVRLLPGLCAVAVVAAIALSGALRRDRAAVAETLATITGGLIVLVLVAAPYLLSGEADLLFRSAVLAPLAYATHETGEPALFTLRWVAKVILLILVLGSIGALLPLIAPGRFPRVEGTRYHLYIVMFAAAAIAVASSTVFWAHYLLLLMPFAAIGLAPWIGALGKVVPRPWGALAATALAAALVVNGAIGAAKAGFQNEPFAQTHRLLAARIQPGDTLYATEDYALYWLLDRKPPHPIVTHAGNMFRPDTFRVLPFGLSTKGELMAEIARRRPTWIVFSDETFAQYTADPEIGPVLTPLLAADYALQPSPDLRRIYRLKN